MPGRSYDLVRQTPGGNPGDGTISGALTFKESGFSLTMKEVVGNPPSSDTENGEYFNMENPNGGVYGFNLSDQNFRVASKYYAIINSGNNSPAGFNFDNSLPWGMGNSFHDLYYSPSTKQILYYRGIGTAGIGIAGLYGDDARTGLTAADASAKTLYTTTAAGQVYRLMGRILATAGTSPSATYTIKWTEGGATITKTLTISALDSDSDLSILIQPDNGTAITAQLTAISGTGTTVNVAATVEQMA